ncbi:MAG: hypothetical protein NT120_04630, partial [Candidatus Aenigmarchaeota archaeon]|nr:hypothetical protein [Candidatus Aenigmarchaeota archaeon]
MASNEEKIVKEIEELRKKKAAERNTFQEKNPSGEVLWATRKMSEADFHRYLYTLINSEDKTSQERADKLAKEADRWEDILAKDFKSENKRQPNELEKENIAEEAIKKAFASVQVRQANDKIKELETRGARFDEIQTWKTTKGHALTQQQGNRSFSQRIRSAEVQPGPKPEPPKPGPGPGPEPPTGGGWYNLSVNVWPENAGRTTPRDGEIYRYAPGSKVTIQQRPNKDFKFEHWSLDGAPVTSRYGSSAALEVKMNNNHSVFAVYSGGPKPPEPGPQPGPEPGPERTKRKHLIIKSHPCKGVQGIVDDQIQFLTDNSIDV